MHYFLILTLAFIVNACQTKKSKASETTAITKEQVQPKNANNLVVSFYSKGAGIDYEIANEFDNFLTTQLSNQINFTKKGWGREGETDFCIQINHSLSQKEKQFVVDEIKQMANKSKLVHIKEDSECRQ